MEWRVLKVCGIGPQLRAFQRSRMVLTAIVECPGCGILREHAQGGEPFGMGHDARGGRGRVPAVAGVQKVMSAVATLWPKPHTHVATEEKYVIS
jgi:hypothetical protein